MAEQEGSQSKKPVEKPDQGIEAAPANPRARKAEKAGLKAKKPLAKAREAVVAAQVEVKEETQPREEEAEQRVSFVVRLTVDKGGRPRRTEIEHAQSGRKETFPALDVRMLTAFMEACITPPAIPEPALPPAPSPTKTGASSIEPQMPTTSLTVSEVQVLSAEIPAVMALTLNPDEEFVIQARFRLEGPEAPSLTVQESSFEVKVFASEVTSGIPRLLTIHQGNLVENILEYRAKMQISGLPPGIYRLLTVVTLYSPIKLVGFFEGHIFQVAEAQSLSQSYRSVRTPSS